MKRRMRIPALLLFAAFIAGCDDKKDPLSIDSGEAARMLGLNGTDQSGFVGQSTPTRPSVLVIDGNNLPVSGVPVKFEVIQGTGTVSAAQSTTGADGEASVVWTLGPALGVHALQATSGSLDTVRFVAKAKAPLTGLASFSRADPAADTLAGGAFDAPRAHDLVSTSGTFVGDTLIITLTFANSVSPMVGGAVDRMGAAIEIDIDDDVSTGDPPFANYFGASADIGVDYAVSLFEASATTAHLFSISSEQVAEIPVTFAGNVVRVRIGMDLLGFDDGNYSLAVILGTQDRPTDYAPNTGAIAARLGSAPTPAMVARAGATRAAAPAERKRPWGQAGVRAGR